MMPTGFGNFASQRPISATCSAAAPSCFGRYKWQSCPAARTRAESTPASSAEPAAPPGPGRHEGRSPGRQTGRPSIGLFWRTFLLLCTLLLVCIAAWLQAFISLEIRPRAVQNAQQLASLVNLSRASLLASDPIGRVLLIKSLADQEALHLTVRQAGDRYTAHRMNWT